MTRKPFMNRVKDLSGLDRAAEAERAAGAVLHTLRDRLTADQASAVLACLPTEVKRVWLWGDRRGRAPQAVGVPEFLDLVRHRAGLDSMSEAHWTTLAVFAVLRSHLSPGATAGVEAQLAPDLKEVWAEAAQMPLDRT